MTRTYTRVVCSRTKATHAYQSSRHESGACPKSLPAPVGGTLVRDKHERNIPTCMGEAASRNAVGKCNGTRAAVTRETHRPLYRHVHVWVHVWVCFRGIAGRQAVLRGFCA